jgi:hypothetical protein
MELHYNLTLAQRDLLICQIEEQINLKKQFLLKKSKELKKHEQENEFLNAVKNDYHKYYNYIIKEKEQQLQAMNMLQTYLDNLEQTEANVNSQLKMMKIDKKYILEEMEKIKNELNNIIQNDENK